MGESLEDFLRPKPSKDFMEVSGSMACQECNEIVHKGFMSESDLVIHYKCSRGHESKVKL